MRKMLNCCFCHAPVWVEEPPSPDPLAIRIQSFVACDRCAMNRGRRNWYRANQRKEKHARLQTH